MPSADIIPAFGALAAAVLETIPNDSTRSMYRKGLTDFLAWWEQQADRCLDDAMVVAYLAYLADSKYSPATINQRLAAIRRVVDHAVGQGLLDLPTGARIGRIDCVARQPVRKGRSLTAEQTELLLNAPEPSSRKGKRDRALLALLVGCALRSKELVGVQVENIQKRDGHWVLVSVAGSRGRVRTLAIPQLAKKALDEWLRSSEILSGPIFRPIHRDGTLGDEAISRQSVLPIVVSYGQAVGIEVNPRDLRRTCAQLRHAQGSDLEQIQLLLGHRSLQTTEQFLNPTPNYWQRLMTESK
jgi:integrase